MDKPIDHAGKRWEEGDGTFIRWEDQLAREQLLRGKIYYLWGSFTAPIIEYHKNLAKEEGIDWDVYVYRYYEEIKMLQAGECLVSTVHTKKEENTLEKEIETLENRMVDLHLTHYVNCNCCICKSRSMRKRNPNLMFNW